MQIQMLSSYQTPFFVMFVVAFVMTAIMVTAVFNMRRLTIELGEALSRIEEMKREREASADKLVFSDPDAWKKFQSTQDALERKAKTKSHGKSQRLHPLDNNPGETAYGE